MFNTRRMFSRKVVRCIALALMMVFLMPMGAFARGPMLPANFDEMEIAILFSSSQTEWKTIR